jgi:3D (Asp-Asp-Asp) domain-containing protein
MMMFHPRRIATAGGTVALARRALGGLRRAAGSIAGAVRDAVPRIAPAIMPLVASIPLIGSCFGGDGGGRDRRPPPVTRTAVAVPARSEPRPIGRFRMTFYYVAGEDEVVEPSPLLASVEPARAAANDNVNANIGENVGDSVAGADTVLATTTEPERVTIYDKQCNPLAEVGPRFLAHMRMQGTGKLRDGRTLNIWGNCDCPRSPCYRQVEHVRWGYAGSGRALSPFRTVAVDPRKIKLGTLLYIPELDGRTMPGRAPIGGFVHDGCVVADDTGGGIQGRQLDLFVGRRAYYKGLARRGSHAWAKKVTVFDGRDRCTRRGGQISRSQRGAI